MATAIKTVEQTTDIAVIFEHRPEIVLLDAGKRDALYEDIEAKIEAFAPDLSTATSRKAIASFAYEITRTKTAAEAAAKRLTEEWRTRTNAVNAERKTIAERLDGYAKLARAPLTEWEEAEKARVAECRRIIDHDIKQAAIVQLSDTAEMIRQRGTAVWNITLDSAKFGDMLGEAQAAKEATVSTLKAALARIENEEADRAELEKLRAESAERDRIEAERRAEEERKAREAEDARIAEQRRAEAEKAEAERVARIQREADDRARREAEASANAEREQRDREHAEALAAERARAEEAERQRKAEADRAAKVEADRLAAESAAQREAERIAAEQANRESDQKHRTKVKQAAKQSIMSCGADEDTARKIVMAIIAGEVPAVSLRF